MDKVSSEFLTKKALPPNFVKIVQFFSELSTSTDFVISNLYMSHTFLNNPPEVVSSFKIPKS